MTRTAHPAVGDRSRPKSALWIIAAVGLVVLGAFPVATGVMTQSSTGTLRQAVRDLNLINAANIMVAQEDVDLQRYILQPSEEAGQRFSQSAASTTSALRDADASASEHGREDARRLANEHANYLKHAQPVIRNLTAKPMTATERNTITEAFAILSQDITTVIFAYSSAADDRARSLSNSQLTNMIATALTIMIAVGLTVLGGLAGLARRRTDRAAAGGRAAQQPQHVDPLTELPDHLGFAEHLRAELFEAQQTGGRGVTVLSIDLTGFEEVARGHGKDGCDQLMLAASRRLRRVVRDIDLVARLGDRGFSVLLHDMVNRPDVQAVTGRIEQVLCRNFRIQSGITSVRASIGIAIGPPDCDPDDLIERSMAMMRRMRSSGGGIGFADHAKGNDRDAGRTAKELIDDLRNSLDDTDQTESLLVEYQPMVRLSDGTTTHLDAIASWQHPVHGNIPPDEIMHIAEDNGLTTRLAARVITSAVHQAAAWNATGTPVLISTHISTQCLRNPGFISVVHAAVESAGCPPNLLGIEVPESAILADDDLIMMAFDQFRRLGIRVTVSEYGVGASSLPRLRRLRLDEVKLDHSLTRNLANALSQQAVVYNAIDMAHTIGLAVAAGHITDATSLAMLHRFGCDHGQGPALSRPVPPGEVMAAMDRAQRKTLGAIMRAGTSP